MRTTFVSHWSIFANIKFLRQTVFKILSKIFGKQNKAADLHIFYEANLCVTLIHYPKHKIPPSNSLQDIKQNHRKTKYRSLTYIYFMRPIFVSHGSIIQSTTFIIQIVFKIKGKITGLWNIGQWSIIFVSRWSIITSVTFIHRLIFKVIGKITGP